MHLSIFSFNFSINAGESLKLSWFGLHTNIGLLLKTNSLSSNLSTPFGRSIFLEKTSVFNSSTSNSNNSSGS